MQKSEFNRTYSTDVSYGNILQIGKVISVNDEFDASRIKVRIKGLDDGVKDENLPWCTPLTPLFFYNLPQEGEAVKILLGDTSKKQSKREWIGPIITQFQNLKKEGYISATANRDYGLTSLDKGVSKVPDALGLYPDKGDIAILGRDNVDIVLKPKSLLLRIGRHELNDVIKRNLKNPAYISLRMDADNTTVVDIVADKINLISHKGKPQFSTNITEADHTNINKNAFYMVKGDILKEFLELIKDFAVNHLHPAELPPNPGVGRITEIGNFDISAMLSTAIQIN